MAVLQFTAEHVHNILKADSMSYLSLNNFFFEVFQLPSDERVSRTGGKSFGNTNEEQQKCNEIAHATDTHIEICEAKDHSLTILVTGKRPRVEEARSRIARELQTQATREIAIPKEHHRVLIGMAFFVGFCTNRYQAKRVGCDLWVRQF